MHSRSKSGETPFLRTCFLGRAEAAKFLLENGADVTDVNKHLLSCLHLIPHLEKNAYEITKLLLENGADVNALNDYERTPLHLAAIHGHPKIVKILLEYGARKDLEEKIHGTPLEGAKYYKKGDSDYQQVIALLNS